MPSLLMDGDTQSMPGVGVVRVDCDDLPIHLLGLAQRACLMVLPGDRKQIGSGRHTHVLSAGHSFAGVSLLAANREQV